MHVIYGNMPKKRTTSERMKEGASLEKGLSGSMQFNSQPERPCCQKVNKDDPWQSDVAGASTYDED